MVQRAAALTFALVVIAVLAQPARAEEPDAQTRFHDAYVLEVIEGEIAEAAKAYLALVADEDVLPRIREEARFRFAILTVLLGRPDEGRMQLAAIVENPHTPANLRDRAKAYLESISTLGVGTELERKLQSLVFDLGRISPDTSFVPAYRDVEIIGAPAIPFFEKLLGHEDANLRVHALRILLRLGDEDAVDLWSPALGLQGNAPCVDWKRYMASHPEALAKLEAKLLALGDETLFRTIRYCSPWPAWSIGFVRALVDRGGDLQRLGFGYLTTAGTREERWELVQGCLLGNDSLRRQAAARWAVDQADDPPDELAAALWLPVVRELATTPGPWFENDGRGGARLAAWARRLDTGRLFEALHALVPIGEAADEGQPNPLVGYHLVSLLANVLAERELEGPALDAWEGLVKRWAAAIAPMPESETERTSSAPVRTALRDVLRRLPPERAASLVGWLFSGPAHERADRFDHVVWIERPEDVPLLVAAVRAVDPAQRGTLLGRLPTFGGEGPAVEVARAELEALPALLDLTSVAALDARQGAGLWGTVVHLVGRVPDDDLAVAIRRLFEVAVSKGGDEPAALFAGLASLNATNAPPGAQRVAFYARAVLPALDALHARLPAALRRQALARALLLLTQRWHGERQDEQALAGYVLHHLDELEPNAWSVLAARPDLFPLVRWLPAAPSDVLNAGTIVRCEFQSAEVDEAMKTLAADPAAMSDAVLAVLAGWASRELSRPVIDRMLAGDDPSLRHRALVALRKNSGYPASPAGLEAALAGLLAEEAPDLGDLALVADLLSLVQPSERLLPAAERLLAADDREANVQGILLARRLGRDALLPALARLLDSLDAHLRDQALAAIQAIRELGRLRDQGGSHR